MPEFNYQEILDTYRDLVQQANAANEERYGNILDVIDQTGDELGSSYDRVGELLQTLGDTQMQRINEREDEAQGQNVQSLIDRGLYNTTVLNTTRRGIAEDAQEARTDVQNQVAQQRAGVLQNEAQQQSQLGRFEASMMERRTDQQPDLDRFSQLLQQAGAGEAQQDASQFLGLSANARSGRDAFGDVLGQDTTGADAVSGGSNPGPSFTGATGGGGGGGNRASVTYPNVGAGTGRGNETPQRGTAYDVDTNPYSAGHQSAFGGGGVSSAIRGSTNQAVSTAGGSGGGGSLGIGSAGGRVGSVEDSMFQGQPVFSRGDRIGSYRGDQQVDLADDLNLIGEHGQLDPNRIPRSRGGNARTPQSSQGQASRWQQPPDQGQDPDPVVDNQYSLAGLMATI